MEQVIEFFLLAAAAVAELTMSRNRLSQAISLQNRNPTRVHLWPSVRALNIHQKCIKFADRLFQQGVRLQIYFCYLVSGLLSFATGPS